MLSAADLRRGLSSLPDFVDTYGFPGGLKRWSGIVYHRASGEISGRSVFEREWDVCIVLDACRADELARANSRYQDRTTALAQANSRRQVRARGRLHTRSSGQIRASKRA